VADRPALFYNETAALPAPKKTKLNLGKTTYYFRAHFSLDSHVAANLSEANVQLSFLVDDGAVVYLNGAEIYRSVCRRARSPILRSQTDRSATRRTKDRLWPPGWSLNAGDNVLAVELHQSDPGSSDLAFGMTLDLFIPPNLPAASAIVLNELMANNLTVPEPDGTFPDWIELYNARIPMSI